MTSGTRGNVALETAFRNAVLENRALKELLSQTAHWHAEPIATIAMACRTPGGIVDPEAYWALLDEDRDAIGPFPDRWDTEALYDPDPDAMGKSYAREGGFLQDVDCFDAEFFGISPREALEMDPQQRLILEVAWEALERAGIRPATSNESNTGVAPLGGSKGDNNTSPQVGVYLGSMGSDYGQGDASLDALDGYRGTGQASSVLSGRLSYVLGLQGPAMTVDTACSSSLVALHLACAGLRQGECDLALAGGVQVMCTPATFVEFSRLRGLAPDGRCKAFSAAADGTGWSEGCGVLVLKRLSDAERDGDRVLALVRGSAVNQDGRSQGLTAPNGPSQQRVIHRALSVAGLTPDDIDAVEAHGTGTELGDPIEAGALVEVFGPTRSAERPLWLGSAKSNLGHTQAAAGVLGVMKMVQSLVHERLPKTLHAETPSEHIAWEGSGLALLQEARPWPRQPQRVRRAGVSSFGVSGTNAHVVLEEAPRRAQPDAAVALAAPVSLPLLVSGRTETALRAQASLWAAWLKANPGTFWSDVLRTAALHRTHFDARAAIQVSGIAEAAEALTALAEARPHPAVSVGQARERGGVVFVFPGQGSQWPEMGAALLDESMAFADAVSACDVALRPHTGFSVLAVLRGDADAPPLERVDVVQPALFAIGVGLAAAWRSLGLEPAAVVAHSQGEITAAVVAGTLSLEDGARVVALRSRLVRRLAGSGGMAVMELPVDAVRRRLEQDWPGLSIAVVNTPSSTVVSGDEDAVNAWVATLSDEDVFCRRVDVDYASHSAHVDAILGELAEALVELSPQPGRVPMVSTVTGAPIDGSQLDADYWCRNLRQPVRLDRALDFLLESGHGVFVEVSAQPVLAMPLSGACADNGVVVGSLRREKGGLETLYRNLGVLHTQGHPVDWAALMDDASGELVALPTYAFQRQRYWLDAPKPATSAMPSGVKQRPDSPLWDAVSASDAHAVAELLDIPEADWPKLASLLPRLAAWHARADADATIDGWCYEERWQPMASPGSQHPTSVGDRATCWLIVDADRDDGWPEALTEALGQGADVERHSTEEAMKRLDAVPPPLDPPRGTVGEHVGASATPMPASILYLPSPAAPITRAADAHSDPATAPWTASSVHALALAQRVCAQGDVSKTRLWFLTPHALSIEDGDTPSSAALQTLWGLGRTLSLEKPHTFGGLLDLPDTPRDTDSLSRVATLLLQPTPPSEGDELALRQGKLWTRRLFRARARHATARAKAAWRPDGTCLVTGGLGALGTHLAHWLAEQGAEHLVLTSRHGPDTPGAAELIAALAEKGCTGHVVACDTQDAEAVDALVARFSQVADNQPLLRHIFHAAGVASATSLEVLTPEGLHQEMAGKVGGAWALHQAVERHGVELEAFVLYGSIAGFWGSGGQAAYSAANAGLTGLAQHRRAQGLPATVFHWGVWADGGMVTAEVETHLARRGLIPMKPQLALHALGQAFAEGRDALAVVDVDWTRFAPALAAERPRPLLHDLPQARAALDELSAAQQKTVEVADNVLRRTLLALPASERHRHLLECLAAEVATVLGLGDSSALDPQAGFKDMGFDSLMAVELRHRIQHLTGLSVPVTLTFDQPNIEAATDWVLAQLTPELSEAGNVPSPAAHGPVALDAPLAIVGVGMRLPGGVTDLESLWRVLSSGTDTLQPIPAERFDLTDRYDPDPEHSGTTYVRHASLLDDVAGFDSALFGISPREALPMDPQHRLLLEATWTALEDAGFDPRSLKDSTTGLFVGIGPNEYAKHRGKQIEDTDVYDVTGSHTAFAAGRLAYHLGLQGPTLSIDTACSSSLVALHLAAEHLRCGRCDLALAGGAQVIADPDTFVLVCHTRAVSPDGRCKTFSANADGFGRGEGVGLLALMRLEDAQDQGRRILGVIRGTAVNHDGASSGITAPNGTSQQKVLRAALHNARLHPEDIDVIECHGTATELGDPIEVQALDAVYGQARGQDVEPLRLGAVKTNLGHLESAAGVAGVLKVLACFRHDALPPTLHCTPPNPHIDWARLRVQVVDTLTPWPRQAGRPRRAGVSGFGLSGTNAHVVLEEAPRRAAQPAVSEAAVISEAAVSLPLLVSGRDETALRAQAGRWAAWLKANPETSWDDVVRAAALHRTHFDARAAIQVSDIADASKTLTALAEGRHHPAVLVDQAPIAPSELRAGKLAMLFTGQGSHRLGMGRDLHGRPGLEAFTQAFDGAVAACDAHLDRSLTEVMWAHEPENGVSAFLYQTHYTQPALFALETALFRQWQAWGVQVDVLLGNSIGELVAAHVAGVLSLEDAAALVCARGRLMDELAIAGGTMASLQAPKEEVRAAITKLPEALHARVDIAGLNTPTQTVVSGDAEATDALVAHFEAMGREATRLNVSHAFHSRHMDGMLEAFQQVAAGLTYKPPSPQVVSSVTGKLADVESGELVSAEYWVKHLRHAVRFVGGVDTAIDAGATTFLECGPDGVLCGMAAGCVAANEEVASRVAMLPSLRKNQYELQALISALGGLHVRGHRIDWSVLFAGVGACHVDLPTYAFQRQRYWLEALELRGDRGGSSALDSAVPAGPWPLAGSVLELPAGGALHLVEIGPGVQGYLADHIVYDTIVVPGAFHLAVFLAIAAHHYPDKDLELSDVQFHHALTFERPEDRVILHVHLLPPVEDGTCRATLAAQQRDVWTTHATATLGAAAEPISGTAPVALETLNLRPTVQSLLDRLSDMHINWGPRWRWLTEIATVDDTNYGHLTPPQRTPSTEAPLAAGLIDNSFVLAMDLGNLTDLLDDDVPFLPFRVERFCCRANANATVSASGATSKAAGAVRVGHITWFDANGGALARMEGATVHRAPVDRFLERHTGGRSESHNLYRMDWQPVVLPEALQGATGLVLGGDGRLAEVLGLETVADVQALLAELDMGAKAPKRLVIDATTPIAANKTLPGAVHTATEQTLAELQVLLGEPRLSGATLVWVTHLAIGTGPDDLVLDLLHAPLWGLVRSARSEHPERVLRLVDVDTHVPATELVWQMLSTNAEPELALRNGIALAARLLAVASDRGALEPPPGTGPWHLASTGKGSLDGLSLMPSWDVLAPLQTGEIRVALQASGLNFLDVVGTLGMVDISDRPMLAEGAGRILEVGARVDDLRAGDRIMGLMSTAGGTIALADRRLLVPVPEGLSTAQAATIPVNFLTALYALQDLAGLKAGERVLVHAAASGTGMAAVQLARHQGAEVFGTASPGKWPVLRASGLDEAHIAGSRDTDFAASFLSATDGAGVDVVLNALAGDFVDASLRLLPRGGRILEMGKTDIRDADTISADHPGVEYRAFDLLQAGPERIQQLLLELASLFEQGALSPLPLAAYDLRHAPAAFKHMANARHVGKLVLQPPRTLERDGTVLLTGGLGELGQVVARHLVTEHGVRHLVLTSRRGMDAPGAQELVASLKSLDARTVRVVACDVANRGELAALLGAIPASRPLTGMFHLAGVLDDGLVTALTPERLGRVLRPKVDGAWNLHALTQEQDLAAFVMFSSVAGVMGGRGQSNYAAANTFLDALAVHRRKLGLSAVSLAWGLWKQQGIGMTAHLGTAELARIERQGVAAAMSVENGLALLDAAVVRPEAALVPVRLDLARVERQITDAAAVPALLRALLRPSLRRLGPQFLRHFPHGSEPPLFEKLTRASAARRQQVAWLAPLLAETPVQERRSLLAAHVRSLVARVLGLDPGEQIPPDQELSHLGIDSLMAVELKNRIEGDLGRSLSATLVFDHPTVEGIVNHLVEKVLLPVLDPEGPDASQLPIEPRRPDTSPLPLSYAQESAWFMCQLAADQAFFNLPEAVHLRGRLDFAALRRTLDEIVRRHEILRTVFPANDGKPRQEILSDAVFPLTVIDCAGLPEAEREARTLRLATEHVRRAFDPATTPLVQGGLYRLANDHHLLVLIFHHLAWDGWSIGIFTREMAPLYDAFSQGRPSPLPEPSLQYADYALWQRQRLKGVLERQLAFWRRRLDGFPDLDLPTDHPRPAALSFAGSAQTMVLPGPALQALSHETGVTLYMILLAAFQVLLARYSGSERIVVGTPVANRRRQECEGLIGYVANVVVMPTDLAGDPSFREVMARVRETATGVYAHQDVPFEMLVDKLNVERDAGRNPIFQVMFAMHQETMDTLNLTGLQAESVRLDTQITHFDLWLNLWHREGRIDGYAVYNKELFDPSTITRLLSHYQVLLAAITDDPGRRIGSLPLLGAAERQWLLERNPTDIAGEAETRELREAAGEPFHGPLQVLDGRGELQPIGVPGTVHVTDSQGRPSATPERGRWLAAGTLELLGTDPQRAGRDVSKSRTDSQPRVVPRTSLERTIAAIWREVLQVDKIGIHDSFFAVGGKSILLAQVLARLQPELKREIAIVELLRYPTIYTLARHLGAESTAPRSTHDQAAERARKQRQAPRRRIRSSRKNR